MISTLTPDTMELTPELAERGLTLRSWRSNSDYKKLSEVLIASRNADGLEEARTGDALQSMYEHLPNFDLTQDLFLMEHDGDLVGYSGCRWSEDFQANYIHMHWVFVLPEWRGTGIENELLRRAQNRLAHQSIAHPVGSLNWYEMFAGTSQTWLTDILLADGYHPARYFYEMTCYDLDNVPDAELPAGIETRPATPDQFRRIWEAQEEAFADHWGETKVDEKDYQRWLVHPLMDAKLWQVAWQGDEIVGMVLNYVDDAENKKYNHRRGYTENISVRRPWRKKGIATALLVKSMKMFRDMGCDHTALAVDTENAGGALRIYENVGYKTHRTFVSYRKQF